MDKNTDSRRRFLGATAAGALGFSTGDLAQAGSAIAPHDEEVLPIPGKLSVLSAQSLALRSTADLSLRFTPLVQLSAGAKLWLFYDIRQAAEAGQCEDPSAADFVSITAGGKQISGASIQTPPVPRTLDLFPAAPEFLHMIEVTLDEPLAAGQHVDISVQRWTGPQQPIDPFRFWLVADCRAQWDFSPIGFRRYRKFVRRGGPQRVPTEQLLSQLVSTSIEITGEYAPVPAASHRQTAGIYWGELHGMVFNQRPLDDYYNYAKNITKLDFCAPFWFSYGTCVGDVWEQVKQAARRHHVPGKFLALAGFECGTPPDDSHRCVIFRDPDRVPPIFCDSRPPAQEPFFQRRLHPDTIICRTLEEFYAAVEQHGGLVTGHFHTRRYDREVLAEMYQKNLQRPHNEEQRIYELLRQGKRMALAGTSDTHDSMPGSPFQEPHLPMAAGFTGVHAPNLTIDALWDAILSRRIYATSGARIVMHLHSNRHPMGSELPLSAPRHFRIELDGTADLKRVELLRDGNPIQQWSPRAQRFEIETTDHEANQSVTSFYLVRVTQSDAHQGWTSPIWFG